jgi:2-methylcitrate dehydratase PrpD
MARHGRRDPRRLEGRAIDSLLERLWSEKAPAEARSRARLLILDTLGCAYAGMTRRKVRELGGDDPAALFATAACWDEACEGLARAHGRPGVAVIAACLPSARDKSVGELLDAVIAGYEIGGRMGEALRIRPGMHVDACWPGLGAAAAVVRLGGGTARQARDAIEIAASQLPFSLYLPVEQGADARNTYLGHAASLGTFAARAALAGFDAPRGAVERFSELALGRKLPPLTHDGYVILEGYLKRHAAVRHVHYGAEAALRLRPRLSARISRIRLSVYPEAMTYCGNRAPRTPIQAQFSLSFGVAAALRFGRLDADLYQGAAFEDAELRRLEALVEIEAAATDRRQATLSVDGLEEHVGELAPMTSAEVRDKFRKTAGAHVDAERVAAALLDGPESQSLASFLPHPLP